jgi:hypothetical protein
MNRKLQSSHLIIFAIFGFFLTLMLIPLSNLLFSEKNFYCKNVEINVVDICKTKTNIFFSYTNKKDGKILFNILTKREGIEIAPHSGKTTVFLKHGNDPSLTLVQQIFKKNEWFVCNLKKLDLETTKVC